MWEKELEKAIEAGKAAQKEILKIYHQKFEVEIKEDNSPVTLADKTADALIRKMLQESFPNYAFLTEESEDDLSRRKNDYCWIVDPVDGTKDFVARNNEFTTNIALAYKGEVVVGVIVIPALDTIYYATKGGGTYKVVSDSAPEKCHVNDKLENLTVLTSRFHVNEKELSLIEKHKDKITKRATFGSSLKACKIAEGKAELSYRMSSGTKEWDIAASQIIVEEAGGVLLKPSGERITYNREDVYNREGYVIANMKKNMLL